MQVRMRRERSFVWALSALVLFVTSSAEAQKKRITPDIYDSWKGVESTDISSDGNVITYEINPQRGDGTLYIEHLPTGLKDSISRGERAGFHDGGKYIVFHRENPFEEVRQLKLEGTKSKDLPPDTLVIYDIKSQTFSYYHAPDDVEYGEDRSWMGYIVEKDHMPQPKKKRRCRIFGKKKKEVESKGSMLYLLQPASGDSIRIEHVTDLYISDETEYLAYITHVKNDSDIYQLHFYDPTTQTSTLLQESTFDFKDVRLSDKKAHIAWLSTEDTAKNKIYSLHFRALSGQEWTVDSMYSGVPEGWSPSSNGSIRFSGNEERLFFGLAPFPYNAPKDTLLDSEKTSVQVWHYQDPRIQPEQHDDLKRDLLKTYLTMLDIASGELLKLENDTIENVRIPDDQNAPIAIGWSRVPYMIERTWEYPWKMDVYAIDLSNGNSLKTIEGIRHKLDFSPDGKTVVWYNGQDSSWYGKPTFQEGPGKIISGGITDMIAEDINGNPIEAGSYGTEGWTRDGKVLINSEFGVWVCDGLGKGTCRNISASKVNNRVRLRLIDMDKDNEYVNLDSVLVFEAFDKDSKQEGVYTMQKAFGIPEKKWMSDHQYSLTDIAKDGSNFLFRRQGYDEFPDLWLGNTSFSKPKQLTHANPQQEEYQWGSVRLVKWMAYDSTEHEGMLYLPDFAEGFEPGDETLEGHSIPMIVYFYELYSDGINRHYYPKPTASIVYPTEYVSHGYAVFIPDIHYTIEGEPGASAYNSIMSGTDHILKHYPFIDSTRLGLQGQSWGGYQTAFMVTQTDRYAAAMAGAPVSNMTSAYGGIRWGSGLARTFQYERGQSRIGVPIWDSLELYIRNSPIFHLPKVETPLLIMHNDEDGAVPWYQGIEMYIGLRRLQKPVWMLNYSGDDHNLMKRPNRMDLSIRMKQFFDHFLQGKEAPVWLKEGVPAVLEGRETGLETD